MTIDVHGCTNALKYRRSEKGHSKYKAAIFSCFFIGYLLAKMACCRKLKPLRLLGDLLI
jgi:hypothetical protein